MPKRIEWLHSVPAVLAISLGLIYGIGAVTIYGQLVDAGVNGVQAMGLVPLDQILSRGIGRVASQFAQTAVAGLSIGAIFLLLGYMESRPNANGGGTAQAPEPPEGTRLSRLTDGFWSRPWLPGSLAFLVVLLFLVGLPMKEALSYLICGAVGAVAFRWMWGFTDRRDEHGMRRIGATYLVGWLAFIASFTVASAFLRPNPLPHIHLDSTDKVIEGGLVTQSGGTWYVAQANDSIIAVSSRKVRRVFITYPKREIERSLVDVVLDRPPSSLFGKPWTE